MIIFDLKKTLDAEEQLMEMEELKTQYDSLTKQLTELKARAEKAEAERNVLAELPRDCIPPKQFDLCVAYDFEDAGSVSETCTKCRLEWAAQEAAKRGENVYE